MKKLYFIALLYFVISAAHGQTSEGSEVIYCSEFHVTKPLSEIFAEHPVDTSKFVKDEEESEDRKHRIPQKFVFSVKDGLQYGNEEKTIQTEMGTIPGRAPIINVAGQSATGFRPMDPSGAPGLTQYVQMINSTTFRVYNKSTGASVLTGTFGSLWSPATPNDGDPIVMYDKAANRWFMSQFGTTGNKIYIAVSQTGDATGAWYTYTFSSPLFPDYLKFSVWADGYYMTSNQTTQRVFAFERTAMLAGSAAARALSVTFSPPKSGFFVPLPGDAADGSLPAAGTPCPIFMYSDNGWGGSNIDAVNIYQMAVNWVPTTPTGTITLAANVPTAAFDASYDVNWNDVSQPGTTQKLDGIGGVCMYRAQWKSWSGYNSVVLNWAVKISTSQRSIKWCELRQNQSTGVWSIYQEGIYTPDAATRWMGGIAMDNNGSIGLSYMKSDATSIFPGLYYTGRRSCDPLGTMPITEITAITGSGSQTGVNRDGDYAHTALDPDGITFWHTSEYMGASGVAKTQIFSYQIAACGNQAGVSIAQTAGSNPMCPGASATFTATPTNGGTTPVYQWQVNGSNVGSNSTTYTTTSLTNGQIVTCIMTSNLAGVTGNPATSNAITMTVNSVVTPSVSIALTSGSNPTCSGSTVIFTATPVNGGASPSYQWKVNGTNAGTNNATFSTSTLTNGQVVSCVMTSNALCVTTPTATSNNITMTVNPVVAPTVSISQTAGTNPQCTGASSTFTASVTNGASPSYQWKVNGTNAGSNSSTYTTTTLTNGQAVTCTVTATPSCSTVTTVTFGTGTGTNPTTGVTTADVGNAYPTYYGNGRQQYLIRASELTALGLTAGNITALSFTIADTVGNPSSLIGYTIKMAQTAATVLTTTFLTPTFTTVYGPVNYTPVVNSTNTHVFLTPFSWDGTSNVVIDICFANGAVTGTIAYKCYQTSSSFVSTTYYQLDGSGGAGACSQATGTGTGSIRPNMIITKGSSASTINSNSITMTVNTSATPAVSISQTGGTNPMCAGASATFTATPTNGGDSPTYQWKVNGTNAGTNSATFTTTALTNGQVVTCVMTSSLACASPATATSGGITMTVNSNATPSVSILQSAGTNPQCAGASATFSATAVNGGTTPSYQWKVNGSNAGTNSATFTTSALTNGQTVTCVMTSNAACVTSSTATSTGITMTVNSNVTPSVSIALTSGTNPKCSGASSTFTATPVNGGSTPSYQWLVNGSNAGTNSTTYTSSAITNGQTVSCAMSSNATCANPVTATSGGITMTVNPNVTPSVSIALTSGTNPECAGASATFTATPTNGGASPSFQWRVNGSNAGTNSLTFTTSSLTNGQTVSCVMTSNASCLTTPAATSSGITMTVNPVLTPSVSIAITSGTNPECNGASVTFTATPVNGGASPSYQWQVNGTNTGTNSVAFTSATLTNGQSVHCIMTSNATCVSPAIATSSGITMTVNPNVTPAVSIAITSGTNPECAGASVTFTPTPVNGGVTPSYAWFVDGSSSGSGITFTSSALTNGQAVSCTMTSSQNCASPATANSSSIIMSVNPQVSPSVTIDITSGSNPSCTGSSITFTATPVNGGATPVYEWLIDGNTAGTNSATFTSSSLNDGQIVSCRITSNANCVINNPALSNGFAMSIHPSLTASVSISANPGNVICENSNVTFTASAENGGANPSYQWKVDGADVGTNSETYSATSMTNGQIVTCVMTSVLSCVTGNPATSDPVTMTVNPYVSADVTITIDPSNTVCAGTPVTFTATPVNGGSAPFYQWKRGTALLATNSNVFTTSNLNNGDVILCEMISNAACVTGNPAPSNEITMTINPIMTAGVNISVDPGNKICAGTVVTFTATPVNGGGNPSYQWKNGSTDVGSNSPSFITSSLSNGDVISCVMTSGASCITGNPATSNSFTMEVNTVPVITSFSPLQGNSGIVVTITGSGFTDATSVDFNGTAAAFTIDDAQTISATVPAGVTTGVLHVVTLCGNAASSNDFTVIGNVTLDLRVLIEGFYLGNGQMTEIVSPGICDTIIVGLAGPVSPHAITYITKGVINTSGNGTFEFPANIIGNSYYIVINHRNTLETWSEVPVTFTASVNSFDFSSSATKAFGNNEVNFAGEYAIRSGDVNQDGVIDFNDVDLLEQFTKLFSFGYIPQDLTGDGIVESSDYSIIENNMLRFRMRP